MTEQNFSSDIRISRELGLWRAITLSLGVMLVLLVYVLAGGAVAAAGPAAPLAYLLATLLLLINVLGYVELAMSVPRPGGAYGLVHEAQGGTWLAFITGWMLTLSGLGMCALLTRGFAVQVTMLLHDHLGLELPIWPWAAGLVILLAADNGLGAHEGRRRTVIASLIIVLLGFTLLAVPRIQLDYYSSSSDAARHWGQSLPLVMVAFVGLEITAVLQNEMRQRKTNAPRALLMAPALTAALGAIIVGVTIGVAGPQSLATSRVPLALLGAAVAGGGGRPFILIIGALALTLDRALMMVVRQVYTMSADGFWPAGLRRMQSRFRTPFRLIVLVAVLVLPSVLLPVDFVARLARSWPAPSPPCSIWPWP